MPPVNVWLMMFSSFDRAVHIFKRIQKRKLIVIGFSFTTVGCYIKESLGLQSSPPNHVNNFLKILPINTTKFRHVQRRARSRALILIMTLRLEVDGMI